jgi:hypothetical protein
MIRRHCGRSTRCSPRVSFCRQRSMCCNAFLPISRSRLMSIPHSNMRRRIPHPRIPTLTPSDLCPNHRADHSPRSHRLRTLTTCGRLNIHPNTLHSHPTHHHSVRQDHPTALRCHTNTPITHPHRAVLPSPRPPTHRRQHFRAGSCLTKAVHIPPAPTSPCTMVARFPPN